MNFKTREIIKELEGNINKSYSLPIFKGYKAINKTGVEKLIDELYLYLPSDVEKAREFLKTRDYSFDDINKKNINSVYDIIKALQSCIDAGLQVIPQTVIVNVKEIEALLNRLQNDMPLEIKKAEDFNK